MLVLLRQFDLNFFFGLVFSIFLTHTYRELFIFSITLCTRDLSYSHLEITINLGLIRQYFWKLTMIFKLQFISIKRLKCFY